MKTIIKRIFGFPFFAGFALICALVMWLEWVWNFIKYGGEAIAYTEKSRRKSILDVYHKLQEVQNKETLIN